MYDLFLRHSHHQITNDKACWTDKYPDVVTLRYAATPIRSSACRDACFASLPDNRIERTGRQRWKVCILNDKSSHFK